MPRQAGNALSILDLDDVLGSVARVCERGCAYGWHERNAGNISVILDEAQFTRLRDETRAMFGDGDVSHDDDRRSWHGIGTCLEHLAGRLLLVSGSGRFLCEAPRDPLATLGVIEIDPKGESWRLVWGLVEGGRPTSELPTHLRGLDVRRRFGDGPCTCMYHAHCQNVITLSNILDPDPKVWNRALWGCMTEGVTVFSEGVAVLPWMVPGGDEIAAATCDVLARHQACVWTQHGVLACGPTPELAFGLVETIEKLAGVYLGIMAATGGKAPDRLLDAKRIRAVCAANGIEPREEYLD